MSRDTSPLPALLQHPLLELPGVQHAFETRQGVLASLLPQPVLRIRQVHGHQVQFLGADTRLDRYLGDDPLARPPADALVTVRRGLTVAVATADCVPVLFADRHGRAVAVAHAGWRGLAAGILPATLAVLAREAGCHPQECIAVLGPCIGPGCYVIGNDVRAALVAAGAPLQAFAVTDNTCWHCDLHRIAREQLLRCALAQDAIGSLDRCTYTDPESFHSYRRDGDAAGRMLTGIALV